MAPPVEAVKQGCFTVEEVVMAIARFPVLGMWVVIVLTGCSSAMDAAPARADSIREVSTAFSSESALPTNAAAAPTVVASRIAGSIKKVQARPKPGGRCQRRQVGKIVASARYGKLRCSKKRVWRRWHSVRPAPSVPTDSVPHVPIPFTKDTVFTLDSGQSNYWIYVPTAYDEMHTAPMTLFVWLHGCGGRSEWDIYTVSPGGSQDYISVAVGGREGGCWDVNSDPALVMATIASVKAHFNINPRRVIIGGYSSGGDLAYRTAFYNASTFAGVLAENTSPFRDTGSSRSSSLAAAAWRFNVVQLAHTADTTYPIADVRNETNAMAAAGFPIIRIERPGHHWDNDSGASGTDYDLRTFLLPHVDDGWLSP